MRKMCSRRSSFPSSPAALVTPAAAFCTRLFAAQKTNSPKSGNRGTCQKPSIRLWGFDN